MVGGVYIMNIKPQPQIKEFSEIREVNLINHSLFELKFDSFNNETFFNLTRRATVRIEFDKSIPAVLKVDVILGSL